MNSSKLQFQVSADLCRWLHECGFSMAFTTYQTNRLFTVGSRSEHELAVQERLFDRPMGLHWHDDAMLIACRSQIWLFRNHLQPGERYHGADRLYAPKQSWVTGDHNTHDVAIDKQQRVVFVNSNFSCIATLSPDYSFEPIWHPPFISKLACEDRCHLNCFAMKNGEPTFATACSATDEPASWRQHTTSGGVLIHIPSNELVATGLSMPHSPRWYRGRLWVLNSGSGELGYIDQGRFRAVVFCPGFTRGLAFFGDFAIVGLSKLRNSKPTGLALEQRLIADGNTSQAGLLIVDLKSGQVAHWIHFPQIVEELYEVVILPDIREPQVLGFQDDDVERLVTYPGSKGLTIIKPKLVRPSTGTPAPQPGLPRDFRELKSVRYRRVYHLTPDNLAMYESMTYPSLQARWDEYPLRGELFGVSADLAGEMIGFGVAELVSADGPSKAALLSLLVLPGYRHQGIGSRIVAELEKGLGCPIATEHFRRQP